MALIIKDVFIYLSMADPQRDAGDRMHEHSGVVPEDASQPDGAGADNFGVPPSHDGAAALFEQAGDASARAEVEQREQEIFLSELEEKIDFANIIRPTDIDQIMKDIATSLQQQYLAGAGADAGAEEATVLDAVQESMQRMTEAPEAKEAEGAGDVLLNAGTDAARSGALPTQGAVGQAILDATLAQGTQNVTNRENLMQFLMHVARSLVPIIKRLFHVVTVKLSAAKQLPESIDHITAVVQKICNFMVFLAGLAWEMTGKLAFSIPTITNGALMLWIRTTYTFRAVEGLFPGFFPAINKFTAVAGMTVESMGNSMLSKLFSRINPAKSEAYAAKAMVAVDWQRGNDIVDVVIERGQYAVQLIESLSIGAIAALNNVTLGSFSATIGIGLVVYGFSVALYNSIPRVMRVREALQEVREVLDYVTVEPAYRGFVNQLDEILVTMGSEDAVKRKYAEQIMKGGTYQESFRVQTGGALDPKQTLQYSKAGQYNNGHLNTISQTAHVMAQYHTYKHAMTPQQFMKAVAKSVNPASAFAGAGTLRHGGGSLQKTEKGAVTNFRDTLMHELRFTHAVHTIHAFINRDEELKPAEIFQFMVIFQNEALSTTMYKLAVQTFKTAENLGIMSYHILRDIAIMSTFYDRGVTLLYHRYKFCKQFIEGFIEKELEEHPADYAIEPVIEACETVSDLLHAPSFNSYTHNLVAHNLVRWWDNDALKLEATPIRDE